MDIVQIINSLVGLGGVGVSWYNIKKNAEIKIEEQKNEHRHQLTKEKYQTLMSEKIDLYNELSQVYQRHLQRKLKIGSITDDEIDGIKQIYTERKYEEFDVYIDTYRDIHQVIQKYNTLLLSIELDNILRKLKLKKEKMDLVFEYEFSEGFIDNFSEELKEKYREYVHKTKDDFEEFFNILKKEINIIREILNGNSVSKK